MNKRFVFPHSWASMRWMLIAMFSVGLVFSSAGPLENTAHANRFGFRGGFRGGFGHSKFRGRGSFGRKRFGSFRRFNYRGFRGFGRSRFHSLAFRGRRFGFSRFNRFGRFNRFRSFGFKTFPKRFGGFRPGFNSFAFSHFPVNRFHSGFGNFHTVGIPQRRFSGITSVSRPVIYQNATGLGWTRLASNRPLLASQAFIDDISLRNCAGTARVGYALASADAGDLDKGVWAMRRAFEMNKNEISKMMLDDSLRPAVARVTRLYEDKMEKDGVNNDTSFMLAALYQLQGDPEMASMAMDAMVYPESVTQQDMAANNLGDLIETEMKLIPMAKGLGWDLLAQGEPAQAMEQFVADIQKDTGDGVAKLGYALAAAEQGDLKLSRWAIDRAFSVDGEDVSDVVLSGELRPVVQSVIERFEKDAQTNGIDKENSMALASLYQLQGDVESAEVVVLNAPMGEDNFVATLIKEEMEAQTTMMDEAMKDKIEIPVPAEIPLPTVVTDSSSNQAPVDLAGPAADEQNGQGIILIGPSPSKPIQETDAKIEPATQPSGGSSSKPPSINGDVLPPPPTVIGSGTR